MDSLKIKTYLLDSCRDYVEQRISAAQQAIERAQSAANNETKSTAGDKHEVGKAMMRADREKAVLQLSEALKLKKSLTSLKPSPSFNEVRAGSLVVTDNGSFYLAISVGRIMMGNDQYITMAPTAPLAQTFLAKSPGDVVNFNQRTYRILEVL